MLIARYYYRVLGDLRLTPGAEMPFADRLREWQTTHNQPVETRDLGTLVRMFGWVVRLKQEQNQARTYLLPVEEQYHDNDRDFLTQALPSLDIRPGARITLLRTDVQLRMLHRWTIDEHPNERVLTECVSPLQFDVQHVVKEPRNTG